MTSNPSARPVPFRHALLCLFCFSFVCAVLVSLANKSQGAAFSKNNFALGGDPKTAAYPNANSNFFRWQQSQISYAFTPDFVGAYGAGGVARVTSAFGTWTAGLTANNTTAVDISAPWNSGTDMRILDGQNETYDLRSVALHEIGHAIGFDHPNGAVGGVPNNTTDSGNGANNYNVVTGDWVNAVLPNGSHPVMWHVLAQFTNRQALTLDDVRGAQFLYSQAAAGAGNGAAGGPVFGNGATGLTFNAIAYNPAALPDILIDANVNQTALASTFLRPGGTFTAVGGFTYKLATNATFMTIQFPIPEPSSIILAIFGAAGLAVVAIRKHRASANNR